MVAAKEPLFVGQLQQDLIKKQVQAVGFAHREGSKIKESAWGIVGQHIIYLPAVCFEIGLTGGVFLIAGHLLRPPVVSGLPLFLVGALGAAEAEVFLSLQLQHAATADMVHIAAQSLDPAAKPLLDGVLGQQVVILVGTIKEKQGVGALAQPVKLFLFLLAAIPHKAEIAQHHHNVPFAQPAEPAVLEAVKLAVGVACQIYHSPLLPLCETVAKPLSLRGKPVIIKGANLCSPFFVISGRSARILYIIAF